MDEKEAQLWRDLLRQMRQTDELQRTRLHFRDHSLVNHVKVEVSAFWEYARFFLKAGEVSIVSGPASTNIEFTQRMEIGLNLSELEPYRGTDLSNSPPVQYVRHMYGLWLEHVHAWFAMRHDRAQSHDEIEFVVFFMNADHFRDEKSPLEHALQTTFSAALAHPHARVYYNRGHVGVSLVFHFPDSPDLRVYYRAQIHRFIRASRLYYDRPGERRSFRRMLWVHDDTPEEALFQILAHRNRDVAANGSLVMEEWRMELRRERDSRQYQAALRAFLLLHDLWVEALVAAGATGRYEVSINRMGHEHGVERFFQDRFPSHDRVSEIRFVTGRLDAHRRGLAAPVLRERTAEDMVGLVLRYI